MNMLNKVSYEPIPSITNTIIVVLFFYLVEVKEL